MSSSNFKQAYWYKGFTISLIPGYSRGLTTVKLRVVARELRIACIGMHATSLLEPLFAWAYANDWPPISATFFGARHPSAFDAIINEAFAESKGQMTYGIVFRDRPEYWEEILKSPLAEVLESLQRAIGESKPVFGSPSRKDTFERVKDNDFVGVRGSLALTSS